MAIPTSPTFWTRLAPRPSNAAANGEFNSDLAAVLFTDGTATANTANALYDILTAFGPESGTF